MFEGVSVALVTPFREGKLDEDAYRRLVRHVLAQGVHGLVPTGSTGEAATLTDEERVRIWTLCVEESRGRAFVLAGTGTNDTRSTLHLTRLAAECGVDGCMLVTPYYNKPTPAGIVKHFTMVADAVDRPLVVYNVPGRTGSNVLPATIRALAGHPRIVAVKEASGNPDQTTELVLDTELTVLSGDDTLTLPLVAAGARGVVSVAGHLVGDRLVAMLEKYREGSVGEAAAVHRSLFRLTQALFLESNPAPVKAALHLLGLIANEVRPPLVPVQPVTETRLRAELIGAGLLDAG